MNLYIKRVIRITVFAAVFLMVFLYLNSLFLTQWDNRDNGVERMETLLSFPEKSSDVLFLGSSGLYAGVAPARMWGENKISSYNLSTSDHNFFARYFKLKQIVENRNLNLVVLDVSYLFNSRTSPEHEKYELNYKQGFNSMKGINNKYDYLKSLKNEFEGINRAHYLFPILKHHNNWDELSSKELELEVEPFKFGSLLSKKIASVQYREITQESVFNEVELKYFKKILNLCEDEKIPVLAVLTPKATNNKNDEQKLDKLSRDYDFDFVNFGSAEYSRKFGLNYEQDFYNEGHLNSLGNRKFSEYLGNYIMENYPNVKIWDESDKDYDEQTKIWQDAEIEYNKFYEKFLLELANEK